MRGLQVLTLESRTETNWSLFSCCWFQMLHKQKHWTVWICVWCHVTRTLTQFWQVCAFKASVETHFEAFGFFKVIHFSQDSFNIFAYYLSVEWSKYWPLRGINICVRLKTITFYSAQYCFLINLGIHGVVIVSVGKIEQFPAQTSCEKKQKCASSISDTVCGWKSAG